MISPTQQIVSTWLITLSGCISAFSSSTIVYMMLSDYERKLRELPNNRFLLMLSVFDILQSIAYMGSSFVTPRDKSHYGAIGNAATCAAQGFGIQVGLTVPIYNTFLCMWSFLRIKHNMQPSEFARRFEKSCHTVAILLPLTMASICLGLGRFEPRGAGTICWLGPKSSYLFTILMSGSIIAVCFVIIVYSMGSIYYLFQTRERMMRRYSTNASGVLWQQNNPFSEMKRKAAIQGFIMSFSFFITFIFPSLNILVIDPKQEVTSPLDIPQSIFLPLQGFWNLVAFVCLDILRIQQEYQLSFCSAMRKLVFHPDEVRPYESPLSRRSSTGRQSPALVPMMLVDNHPSSSEEASSLAEFDISDLEERGSSTTSKKLLFGDMQEASQELIEEEMGR